MVNGRYSFMCLIIVLCQMETTRDKDIEIHLLSTQQNFTLTPSVILFKMWDLYVFSEKASPADNVDVCQCIHTLVRAALHVCSLNPSANRTQLHQLACQLVRCSLLPLDTRTNCGLLVVSTNHIAWPEVITTFTNLNYILSHC